MAASSSSAQPVPAEAFPDGTSDFKPLRAKQYDVRKPHISEQPFTTKNWYKHVNWLNTTLIIGLPLCGLVASYWVPLDPRTLIFSVLYYFNTGLGITAGRTTLPPQQRQRLV